MEFIDLVNQNCPPAIQQSVALAGTRMDNSEETLLFSPITSARLDVSCAYAVVGHLTQTLSRTSSDTYKLNYLLLATQYANNLTSGIDALPAANLRDDIGRAIGTVIDDIQKPHLQGAILAVLMAYRINLTDQIATRVNYKELAVPSYLGNWMFNEYALCMGDATALDRIATVFSRSGAQDLRIIFTEIRGKHVRGGYCISPQILQQLVRPYLSDGRRTADVSGEGPPVSRYARDLLDVL